MRYFKVLDEDGYVMSVGIGVGGETISSIEYMKFQRCFNNKPSKYGYEYKLNQNYTWKSFELDRSELSDEEVRKIFEKEILASVEVSKKPESGKEGYILEQVYDPSAHMIIWVYVEDPNYEKTNSGTYLDPITYTEGMEVETGKWYTDGENIWDAIKDGIPTGFDDTEYFNIITL